MKNDEKKEKLQIVTGQERLIQTRLIRSST